MKECVQNGEVLDMNFGGEVVVVRVKPLKTLEWSGRDEVDSRRSEEFPFMVNYVMIIPHVEKAQGSAVILWRRRYFVKQSRHSRRSFAQSHKRENRQKCYSLWEGGNFLTIQEDLRLFILKPYPACYRLCHRNVWPTVTSQQQHGRILTDSLGFHVVYGEDRSISCA